ncbi:MAG: SDR family NAD(P)-dependent oxidoreductase, partial [Alphaproteobacteria bacterium]
MSNDSDAAARELFGMVARRELTAAQAATLVAKLRAARASAPPAAAPAADGRIAIIGMAGRFPGADGIDAFWRLLAAGRSAVSPHPPARWGDAAGAAIAGGWLDDIHGFDHAFFGIPRREAEVMDPQQALFLESAWAALEHAGQGERDLAGRRVGVFVGAGAGDYASHLMARGAEPDGLSFMGNSNAILAGRIAYLLNLRGPCLTVDTACSSSLTAVHLARESLLTGGCDMAIAGGVCVLPTPTFARAAARAGMLSPTGTCRAFDAAADGFVPGEAVAALVLKPLDRALADGDHVWGVIEASGANQDGRTNGITAPSAPAQAALLSEVHDRWGIDPATIGYVEAHGTGTRLGDPIEVEALTRSFRRRTAEAGFCALGSVKPSVGHTMSAAGAVGIVKLLLALAHRRIPPSLNYAEPNPACAFPGSPFFVPTALMPWEERGGTRRGAVSAFGFSGSNVHIVIAEAPARPAPAAAAGAWPILLSAATPTALRALAAALADDAERQGEGFDLPGACWTLAAGRIHHRQRAAAVVGDTSGFVRALRAIAEGRPPADAAGDRALMEIVARYRAGGAVDPDTIAAPAGRRRVPLPTYPFERVSCALRPATRPRILRGLHPLLDTALPGDPVRYRTAIDVDEPFLADHKVDGRAILPGACIAAMALAAKPAAGLADITFRAPVGAVEAAGLVLRLEGDGFALAAEAAPDRTLAAGRYLAAAPAAPERIDLAAVRARTAGAIEGEALAGRFAAAGVALGPLFRGVRRLWLGDGEALAELTLSGEELAGLDAYAVHPTLLDGTFQAGMAALSAATPEAGAVLVPAGIGEVAIHAPVGPECLAHVVLAPDGVAADRARFQARLLDPDGNVLVAIRDFVALRLAPAAPAPAPAPTAAPVPLFVPAWRETAAAAREARAEGVTLIVRDSEDGGLGDALARAAGGLVLQVILGTETISRAVGVYEIDRADEAAMVLLLATMKPLAAVWVLGRARPVAADAAALDAAATEMLLPRLRCLQALAGLGERARDVPVLLVTVGAQAADAGEVPDAGAAMLAGLGTAAAREVAPLKLGVVDLSPAELAAASDALAGRLLAEPVEAPGRIVALRGERRLLRTLVAAPAPDGAAARFKDGGAYVIVGGAGGLGLALARHLAERHAARLLLIGRSPLAASQQRAIAAIEAAGGTVLHVRADAADPAQLDAALAEGRRRFGRFDGAVQAAMVLRDGPLMALDAAGLATVLAPKLAATANLARALAPDRPDMLVIFSSANAFIGNRGQANYAAAAAGQDALGLALRAAGMPVTVIDWGYWGEVGAVAAPVYLERAARLGIGAIGIAEGIAALETVLARGLPQAMAMKVSAEALTALGIPAEAAPAAEAPAAETPAAETPAAETPAAETPAAETPAAETPAPEADALTAQFAAFEAAARDRLAGMFQRAGFLQAPGQSATVEELKTLLAVVPIHLRLFDAVLDILERGGLLLRRGDRLEVTDAVLDPATAIRMESPGEAEAALEAEAPWLVPFIAVTRRCLERYADALAGRIAATELLFPGGSTELVAPLYRDNPIADHFNGAVVAAVLDAARARAGSTPFVVTEVGAGTGGTAVAVMQALADAGIDFRYRFTDLSPTLVRGARAALARRFPGAEFAVLDLERPLADALRGGSDVVVAVNVLHATADVGFTSAICRALLRPGGLLVLNEAVRRRDFATLVFGLTDGWWRFRDGQRRLPHSPLLDRAGWRATLAEAGFGSLAVTAGADPEDAQAVMVATAGQAIPAQAAAAPIRAEALEPMSPAPTATGTGAALAVIRRALAEALRVPLDTIEDGAGFAALGVDSIVGVDLMERISVRLGVSVPMTALFDHPSPAALAVYLTAEHPTLPAFRTAAPAAQPSLPASLPTGAVAIVGMAGSWPGAADTDAFWRNLAAGVASIGEPPPGRWPGAEPATGAWSRGGFLDAVDRFEPLFFEMSGIEADHTDPQARLFLTTAWHALEDAGWGPAALDGRRCGVFVGAAAGDYPSGAVPGATPPPHAFMGNAQSVLAGRIAYLLNLRGPTLAVDTACSSSLVALHLACRAILDGECAMALAGGVFVTSTPAFHRLTATLGMTSPRGTTRAFDDGADGFVPGEGVGVVVLRRLEDAVADGDRILGVVRATGVNSDGRTHGMTAPSARAQADLVADVLARAGLPAAALDYVEAHGTGTPLGDPIEVEALARVLGAGEAPGARCLIGSVKTNIGHAGPAAGMAGLQKVLLALRHETLPASLNFATPNRHIDFTAAPVAVCDRPTPWPRRVDRPRRAGVSGFGLSGTNAHAVIEEAPAPRPRAAIPAGPWLFPISARTGTALARRIADLAAWLDGAGRDAEPADIAWTLAIGRRHFAHRRVFVAADRAGLRRALVNGAQLADALSGPLAAARADYLAGGDPDWRALHAGLDLRRVPLPVYPFEGAHHWVPVVAAPQPRPAPARLYAPVWEAAPPPAIAGAGEFAVLDDQDDLAAALAAHGRVVRRTFGEIALAPVIVVRPPVAHDPVAAATAMLALARAADDGVKRRVLIVVPEQGGAGAEAAAAATALEPALRSAVAWSVLRTGAGIPVRDLAAAVAVEAAAGEAEVLLRGDDRLARRMRPLALSGAGGLPGDAVCWIVGGSGAIGTALAGHLRRRHGARVVLSSRHAPADAAAEFLPLDVRDAAAVAAAAAEIRARHGRIDAVFHLAGAMRRAPLAGAAPEAVAEVLGAKMAGAVHLHRATAADRLSAFVLFSSLAGELGDFGQGDYALANRFLGNFAAARRGPGGSLAIAWPVWRDGRMAAPGRERDAALAASGLDALETEAALDALDALLGADGPVAVLAAGGRDPFTAPVPRAVAMAGPGPLAEVRGLLAAELHLPAAEIADDAPFGTLGLDSLHVRGFAERLTARFGTPVAPSELFGLSTVRALAAHLGAAAPAPLPAMTVATPAAPTPAPVRRAGAAEPIAIIGMAGRFPGASDIDAFWAALAAGHDLVGEVPADRWDWRAQRLPDGTAVPRWGGFIDGVDRFDAGFFGISAREAAYLDPQARLLLETAWHALEDAAVPPGMLAGTAAGVFVGSQLADYAELVGDAGEAAPQAVLGNTRTMLANRLSHALDLRGPSEAVDTACSSSLVAIHRAVRSLREGESDLALTGGTHLILTPRAQALGAQLGMLSSTGRCRTFDAAADGYVRGEGVAVVVLKRLADAERDGDPIRAVILESGENHGGRASGLTAPNPQAQADLIAGVLRRAGVPLASIGHVEAHGTGTALGDPIEVDALNQAFARITAERGEVPPAAGSCRLSSVKSSIGHLEPASGVAGLVKSVLALERGALPATLHVARVNPLLRLDGGPFRLVTETEPWPAPAGGGPRRACVSSFGLGGSNAHVLLETAAPRHRAADMDGPAIVPLSARDPAALRRVAERIAAWLPATDAAWPDIVATLRSGREAMAARLAVVASSPGDLARRLGAWLAGEGGGCVAGAVDRDGLSALFDTPEDAADLVARAVDQGRPERLLRLWVAGVPVDWRRVPAPVGGRRRSLPGYPFAADRHWFDRRPRAAAPAPAPAVPPPPVAAPAPAFSPSADAVRTRLCTVVADALYLDAAALDIDANLVELGVDSILAVEIARKLQDAFAITLPATRLYDAPTIRRLAALIAEGAGDAAAPPAEPIPAPPPSPAPGGDVLARLNALLAETLYLEPGAIDPDQPFTEIGLDSILAVELARRIEGEFGVALRATRLYDQPTPRGLAVALAAELGAATQSPVATAPTAPAVPDDPILARLRDKVAA